jgi:hypothetical protein
MSGCISITGKYKSMPNMEKNLEIKKYEKFRKARFVGF